MAGSVVPSKAPKPCPTCYAPMRLKDGVLACERHGAPRPRVVKTVVGVPPELAAPTPYVHTDGGATAARPEPEKRFPSDSERYPKPPSEDGRARYRTTRGSPTTARSLLTPRLMKRAAELTAAGWSPHRIAGAIWKEAGYRSQEACKGSLYRALRKAGVVPYRVVQ